MTDTVTLSDIEMLVKQTIKSGATPHRDPDFKAIRKLLARQGLDTDPAIGCLFSLLEEHNTGYDGPLVRYLLKLIGTDVTIQVDLLPGMLVTRDATADEKTAAA